MKHLKRFALAITLLAGATTANAAGDTFYLHIKTSAGWQVLSLDQVDRLSFSGSVMSASDADGNVVKTFDRKDLSTLVVADTPDSAAEINVAEANAGVAFTFDNTASSLTMLADGPLDVYDLTGAHLVSIPSVAKGDIVDLSALPKEMVIIKSGSYNLKTALK